MTSNCKLYFLSGDISDRFNLILIIEKDSQSSPPIQGHLSVNTEIFNYYKKWRESYFLSLNNNRSFRGVFEFDKTITTNQSNQNNNKFNEVNFCRKCWHDLQQEMRRWLEENSSNLKNIESALNGEFNLYPQDSNLLILTNNHNLWKLPWYEWQILINHSSVGVSFGFSDFKDSSNSISNFSLSQLHNNNNQNNLSFTSNSFSFPHLFNQIPHTLDNLKKDFKIYFARQKTVKILGVLGNDTIKNSNQTLNLNEDKKSIKGLTNAIADFLDKPQSSLFIKSITNNYDIISYAGHSKDGLIEINDIETIRIGDFNHYLTEAIENKGLKILIFNSCDGLPFSLDILRLNLPLSCIVMQEPISDQSAYLFLRKFLTNYSNNISLSTSVRLAQQNLQGEAIPETELAIPGVESLPKLIQSPSVKPPTYQELQKPPRHQFSVFNLKSLIAISLIITMTVTGLRFLGKLQPMELIAYDNLIQQKIPTKPDSRFLVIRVTPKDESWLTQCANTIGAGARTLSDANIGKIINKLQSSQAKLIGIDIFREGDIDETAPVKCKINNLNNADHPNNVKQFRSQFKDSIELKNNDHENKNNNVTVVCLGNTIDKPDGISAPNQAHSNNIGFADLVVDKDNIIRRQLLYMSLKNPLACKGRGKESFSLNLAQRYLAEQGIIRQDGDDDDFIQLGKAIFPPLQLHRGFYNIAKDKQEIEGGIQIILNYRPFKNYTRDIVPSFTLQELFENKVTPNEIKDKIVLVGVDKSYSDRHYTPFRKINQTEKGIPGVFIHAQMTSYILDVVKGKRRLMWSFPWWIDMLFIGVFGLISGAIVFILSISKLISRYFLIVLIVTGISNYLFMKVISWLCFNTMGLWFPSFPCFLAMEMTIIGAYLAKYLRKKFDSLISNNNIKPKKINPL